MGSSVSIIMTPFRRTNLLAVTLDTIFAQRYPNLQIVVVEDRPAEASTELLCLRHNIPYACRRGHDDGFANPAPLLNRGIQMATGDILLFQNAECKHEGTNVIERLVAEVDADPMVSAVPLVQSLGRTGKFEGWLMHPTDTERAGWMSYFCQAVRREPVIAMRGFDERYRGYGFEDDSFEFRLRKSGIKFKYVENALVSHQWHPRYVYTGVEKFNEIVFQTDCARIEAGGSVVANEGIEWGRLD
jgi:GT2 family glycosyltransferase